MLSVIIDNPGTWSSELAITGTIKRFIPIDMEGPTVVQDIVSALQGLNDEVRQDTHTYTLKTLFCPGNVGRRAGRVGRGSTRTDMRPSSRVRFAQTETTKGQGLP